MRGAIPPLLQYVFMAWCSVNAQGQLYLLPQQGLALTEKNEFLCRLGAEDDVWKRIRIPCYKCMPVRMSTPIRLYYTLLLLLQTQYIKEKTENTISLVQDWREE
jgi:hypothetical protein